MILLPLAETATAQIKKKSRGQLWPWSVPIGVTRPLWFTAPRWFVSSLPHTSNSGLTSLLLPRQEVFSGPAASLPRARDAPKQENQVKH